MPTEKKIKPLPIAFYLGSHIKMGLGTTIQYRTLTFHYSVIIVELDFNAWPTLSLYFYFHGLSFFNALL